jgi:hypothetical protein
VSSSASTVFERVGHKRYGEDGAEVGGGGERRQLAGAAAGEILETDGRELPEQREGGGMGAVGNR